MEGFRDAIEIVVEEFVDRGRSAHSADTLIYPLGFLARHLVELRLKELYRSLIGEPRRRHQLIEFWQELRPAIESRWSEANRSTLDSHGHLEVEVLEEFGIELRAEGSLDRAEGLITAIDALDPDSFTFRYPGTAPASAERVSIEKFAAAALELDGYLDGLSTGVWEEESARAEELAEVAEVRAEMEAEMRAEMAGETYGEAY